MSVRRCCRSSKGIWPLLKNCSVAHDAVHATPAVRVLRRLVTEQQLVDEEAEDDPQYYAEGAGLKLQRFSPQPRLIPVIPARVVIFFALSIIIPALTLVIPAKAGALLGPRIPSKPILRAVPSAAATRPCGRPQTTVKASCSAAMTVTWLRYGRFSGCIASLFNDFIVTASRKLGLKWQPERTETRLALTIQRHKPLLNYAVTKPSGTSRKSATSSLATTRGARSHSLLGCAIGAGLLPNFFGRHRCDQGWAKAFGASCSAAT